MLASLNRTKTSDLVIATWPLAELYSFFSVKSRRQGKYINSWWKKLFDSLHKNSVPDWVGILSVSQLLSERKQGFCVLEGLTSPNL